MDNEIKIVNIDSTTFETQGYSSSDENLIIKSKLDTRFIKETDYIEYFVYDENQNPIFPDIPTPLYSYSVRDGDVLLDPSKNLLELGFNFNSYFISYNFYRKLLASSITELYFISEINSNRTEIRLNSTQIEDEVSIKATEDFIKKRENSLYFVDFKLNFGSNKTLISNNIALDLDSSNGHIIIKLYDPLPLDINLKDTLWVVDEISNPQSYKVTFPQIIPELNDTSPIAGPNFHIDVKNEKGDSGLSYSYTDLMDTPMTSSQNQLKSLLSNKGIKINVDYSDFSNFVNFSSAKTRLENFHSKVKLIEDYNTELSSILDPIVSDTSGSSYFSSSKASITSEIDFIVKNFDEYEYFLYFNSGSQYSYPKSNSTPPYQLYTTGSVEALTWLGSTDTGNAYYGGLILSASNYDDNNKDWLYNSIPEYLLEDPENRQYELFLDMVGQHFDNIWIYIKDVSNKFSMDNRLDYGISKDLVADAIKDFGVKLYSNNFNQNDLFTAFLGITNSGSLFPFPEITTTFPAESGYEYIDTQISSSNDVVPLDDINKRIYKRIYHNLPYLLKTKGTTQGIRALITSYGIPDTILRINEFGGKNTIGSQEWDLKQNKFNYKFNSEGANFFTSSFELNSDFEASNLPPKTIEFRFQTDGIPTAFSQSLWVGKEGGTERSAVLLEYENSGNTSGSYSGSVYDPENRYGTLKYLPNLSTPTISSSLSLPFFDEGWWSVMVKTDYDTNTSVLHAANVINNELGFSESSSIDSFSSTNYKNINVSYFPNSLFSTIGGKIYTQLDGYYQEIRYYNTLLSESSFIDYVLSPYSAEGNTLNSSPLELAFRAPLGTLLDTGSRNSVHPRVTGSYVTQSFASDSLFHVQNEVFVSNKEILNLDQPAIGVKNRTTDKIQINTGQFPEQVSGSGVDILSPFMSTQQGIPREKNYTNNVDYVEIALSPSDEINDDIISQLGYFNIGDYIGDPRQFSGSSRTYSDLDTLRDSYFEKYIKSYDVIDFIRLIKFFDNSLFKMIKDFIPARTSLASGIVIKQHLLERNKHRPALITFSNDTYSGSIKPQSRNYSTGSGDHGFYDYDNSGTIYRFRGGTGGGFERYNGFNSHPSASQYGLSNQFGLTQSYSESFDGPLGPRTVIEVNQEEFYDGEFSGSRIEVSNGELNEGCDPYKKPGDTDIYFNPIFFTNAEGGFTEGVVKIEDWINKKNSPVNGDMWIISEEIANGLYFVKHIKLANQDISGKPIKDFAADLTKLEIVFPEDVNGDGNGGDIVTYYLDGWSINAGNITFNINNTVGDYRFTSSINGGSENWSLSASGDYTQSGASDLLSQGVFLDNSVLTQEQTIKYWNGTSASIYDPLGFFNTGSSPIDGEEESYEGGYNIKRTPNVPWIISASLAYSASDLGFGGTVESLGIFHSASNYQGAGLVDQSFTLSTESLSGVFIPAPRITELDPTIFSIGYNTQVLGNYNIGQLGAAGHPHITTAGTSTLDFYFPSWTIGGDLPGGDTTPIFSPVSASILQNENLNFTNIVRPFISHPSQQSSQPVSMDTPTYSSEIYVTRDKLADAFNILQIEDVGPTLSVVSNTETLQYVELRCNFQVVASPLADLTVAVEISTDGFLTSILRPVTVTNNGTGLWQVSGDEGNLQLDPFPYSPYNLPPDGQQPGSFDCSVNSACTEDSITWETMSIRLAMKSSDPSPVEYQIPNYNLEMRLGGYVVYWDNFDIYSTEARRTTSTGNEWIQIFSSQQYVDSSTYNIFTTYGSFPTAFHSADIQVNLYYTGSDGNVLLTSSDAIIEEDIYLGKTFTFDDSPILGISKATTNTASYYMEYSMSNFVQTEGTASNSVLFQPLHSGDTGSAIMISHSVAGQSTDFNCTGSFNIKKTNPSSLEETILTLQDFIIPTNTSEGVVQLSGSIPPNVVNSFAYDDVYFASVAVSKSYGAGLTINEYTMSIYPDDSKWSPISEPYELDNYRQPTASLTLIPTYYGGTVIPWRYAKDCQPLLNNYNDQRASTYFMNVDYSNVSGSSVPVNFQHILSQSAERASTPDSNYTIARIANPRYNGSRTTGHQLNVWTPKDINTYGKLPVIESRTSYFGYFNLIKDPYPNINNNIALNLTYLIDEVGNAIPPSLEGIGYYNLVKSFPVGDYVSLAIESGSKELKELNDYYPTNKVGQYITPIMYSQTSSTGSTSSIPLTGSRYISRYDNADDTSVSSYSFTSEGSSSIDNFTITSNLTSSFNTVFSPTENVMVSAATYITSSYSSSGASVGTIEFPLDTNASASSTWNANLSDNPFMVLETKVDTSFLYASGKVELEMKLILENSYTTDGTTWSSSFSPPTLDDLSLTVVKTDGSKINLGSVISSNNDIVRFVTGKTKGKKFFGLSKNRKKGTLNKRDKRVGTQQPIVNNNNEIEMVFENYALNKLLQQRGLYGDKKGGEAEGGVISYLQWNIKANSGETTFNQGNKVRWILSGSMVQGKKFANSFFPSTNPTLPTKLKVMGSWDHFTDTDNTAQPPYWVTTGSSGGGTDIINRSILVMSSSNMNEAYGIDFYQGDLPYNPGPSQYFPGGSEPSGTQFDKIVYPLNLTEGDEIRFVNNENYSYVILNVTPPQENIEGDGKGRLKIELDGEVPDSIDKNFFLVRRYIDNANSVLINNQFPYSNPPSGSSTSGILFPEFPVISLQESSSKIITDLVGKGVIN